MNLKAFAWIAVFAPFAGPQGTIKIDSVEPTMAYEPEQVAIHGSNLDLIEKVQINGVAVRVLHQDGTTIYLVPKPQDPGFAKLELFHSQGSILTAIEFMPSVQASMDQNTMKVSLDVGEPGPYWLYFSTDLLSTPLIRRPIYYCGMLDLTSRYSGMFAKGVSDGSPVTLAFRIPPWMAPTRPIHIQGLCLYPTGVESEWSFSNAFTIP